MGSLFLQFESRKNFTTQPWPPRVEAAEAATLLLLLLLGSLHHWHHQKWGQCEEEAKKKSISLSQKKSTPRRTDLLSVKRPREILRFVWPGDQTRYWISKIARLNDLLLCVRSRIHLRTFWTWFQSFHWNWFHDTVWNIRDFSVSRILREMNIG